MKSNNAKRRATRRISGRRDKQTAVGASNASEQIAHITLDNQTNRAQRRLYLQNKNIITHSSVLSNPDEDEKYSDPSIKHQNNMKVTVQAEKPLSSNHNKKQVKTKPLAEKPRVVNLNENSIKNKPKYNRLLSDEEVQAIIKPDKQKTKFDPVKFAHALEVMHFHPIQIVDAIAVIQGGVDPDYYLKPIVDNHLKQLMKTKQNDNDFPQHPIRHYINYYLTPAKINLFRLTYPHLLPIISNKQCFSNTPLLDDLYVQFTNDIYSYADTIGMAIDTQYVDIRMQKYIPGMPHLWCCKPVMHTKDICQTYETTIQQNCCSHIASECDCVNPDVYLSIDSIYEFTPHEIALLVIKSKHKLLLAAHHNFEHSFGSIMGELNYIVEDELVKCTVNNEVSYKSNLSWMRAGAYHFKHKKKNVTLAWKKIKTYQSSSITMFTVHNNHIPHYNQQYSDKFIPALQNENYYGNVNLTSGLSDTKVKDFVGEHFTLDEIKIYSWGSHAIMFNTKTQERYYTPKNLVTHMSLYCMGKVRNVDSFKNALGHARIAARNYNIPPNILDDSLFAATTLGFISMIAKEIKIMHSIIKPVLGLMDIHTKAMAFDYKTVLSNKVIAAMALLIAGIGKVSGLALAAAGVSTGLVPAAILTGAASVAAVTAAYNYSQQTNTKTLHPFTNYKINFASNQPSYRSIPLPLQTLPARPIEITFEELEQKKIDRTANIQFGDLSVNRKTKEPILVAGIVSTMSMPIVLENSAIASAYSIVSRPLTPQLVHTVEFDFKLFNEFYHYSIKYFDEFLPDVLELRPKDFSIWNSKFTLSQQKIHQKALLEFNVSPSDRINTCGSFPKIESVIKSTTEGAIPYDPRNIASRDPQHNVVTAPFIHAMSDLLAKMWCIKEEYGLVYTSKVSADAIGEYFYNSLQGINRVVAEGDYKRYDTTIHIGFLLLERDYYALCGASQTVLESLTRSIKTVAYDKFGTKFSVDGVRHSGDPNTSCGNTLIQGLATTFCLAKCLNKEKPPSPKETWNTLELYSVFLGDDSSLSMLDKICIVQYTKYLRGLGLQLEPKLYKNDEIRYYSTFCSARFVPVRRCSDHSLTMVLTAPIGRLFAKVGYYTQTPEKMDSMMLVKGDALSRIQDCHCIPFSSHYWKHIIKILSSTKAATSQSLSKDLLYKHHIEEQYYCSDETWEFFFEVYKLTRCDLNYFSQQLLKINKLPHVLDLPMMHYPMVIDGMCEDTENQLEQHGIVDIEPCDMTEVPLDVFVEQAKIHCPILLSNINITTQNDIDLDVIGL